MGNPIKRGLKYVIIFVVFIVSLIGLFYLSQGERLPTVGTDSGNWGSILNAYLLKEHTENGTHRNVSVAGEFRVVNGSNTNQTFFIVNATTGNVGIGTTMPLLKLDVAGSARVKGATTSVLTGSIDPEASITVTGVGTLFTTELVVGDRITVSGETRTVTAIASDTSLTVHSAFSDNANDTSPDKLAAVFIVKDSSDNVNFFVQDSGRVGVGTTIPGDMLDVQGAVSVTGDTRFNMRSGDTTNMSAGVGGGLVFTGEMTSGSTVQNGIAAIWGEKENGYSGDRSGQLHLGTFVNGGAFSSDLVIDSAGKVGIGTTSPNVSLDVSGQIRVNFTNGCQGTCNKGAIAWNESNNKICVCVSENTWYYANLSS